MRKYPGHGSLDGIGQKNMHQQMVFVRGSTGKQNQLLHLFYKNRGQVIAKIFGEKWQLNVP